MNWTNWLPAVLLTLFVAGAIIWYNQPDGPRQGQRTRSCHSLAGEPGDRVQACFREVPTSSLSTKARATLDELAEKGGVLAVGAKLPRALQAKSVADHADVLNLLMGKNEEQAAKKIQAMDVHTVVVHRDLVGAVDRDNVVLARLSHHDHLEWFKLRYVTSDLFVYVVRHGLGRIDIDVGDRLLRGLRARLEGLPREDYPVQTWQPDVLRIIGVMRLKGNALAYRHEIVGGEGQGKRIPVVDLLLDGLGEKLRREWERKVEPDGHGRLADVHGPTLRLEIHVVMERAPVEPRSRDAIFELWEMGVDGMMFRQREPKRR